MDWTLFLGLFLQSIICTVIGQDSSQMPPNMTSILNDEYSFPRDSKLTDASFNCKAENGRVIYEWKKDGYVVLNSQFIAVDKSMGILKFLKMQNEDYGTYQCFATNDYGTSLSKPFKIMEARLGSFPPSQTQEIKCEEFKHCKVECRHKPTCLPESQCKVEWKIGEGTKTNVEINKRVGVDGNGNLHFLWTNMSDWTGQQYRCGVWHEQLKTLVAGSQTSLRIDSATAVQKVDPMLVFKENGKVLIGEKGVLRCMFSGYPVPDITWISPQKMNIDNADSKYEISDFGRVLTILRAESENEGKYTCKHSGKNETVFLNVTSAPFLNGSNQMQDLVLPEGQEATFRCEAESSPDELPPTRPTWKKNGVDLKIDGGKYLLGENSQVLSVKDVQKSDSGVYQCMSENSEGVLLKEAILKVTDPIKTTVETGIITMKTTITSTDIFTTDIAHTEIVNTDISSNIITTKVVPKTQNSKETGSNAAVAIIVTLLISIIVLVILVIVARRIQQRGSSMDKKELATGHDSENERKETSLKDQPV